MGFTVYGAVSYPSRPRSGRLLIPSLSQLVSEGRPSFVGTLTSLGWTTITLAVLASMGGFILLVLAPSINYDLTCIVFSGYDTGQISDILLMDDFRQRFGQLHPDGSYAFSNAREGLIVGMLSIGTLLG